MFRFVAWIGLREVHLEEGIYEFRQDFIGVSLFALAIGAATAGPGICLLCDFGLHTPDVLDDAILALSILAGTACALAGIVGLGRTRRVIFDYGKKEITVRTRSWWRKSEARYAYNSGTLRLHQLRAPRLGRSPFKECVLMVMLPDCELTIGWKQGRIAPDLLAKRVAEELCIPWEWSDEVVKSLI